MAQTTIPVVNFASWSSDQSHRQRVAQDIVAACKQVGFVYIVNHSLPETLLEDAFRWTGRFFDLPETEKLKAPHPEGWAVHRGYSWLGLEKVSQAMSEKNDQERVGQLREIPDFKVKIPSHIGVSQAIFEATVSRLLVGSVCDTFSWSVYRKATTLAAMRTPTSPTSGFPRMHYRGSGPSWPGSTGSVSVWEARSCRHSPSD